MKLIEVLVAIGGFAAVAILIKNNKIPERLFEINLYGLVGVMFLVILFSVVIGTVIKVALFPILITGMCSAVLIHKTFDVFK